MDEETRRFLDALLARHVEVTEELIQQMRAGFAALQAEIADQREQIQANTNGILSVLDRLPPGPQES